MGRDLISLPDAAATVLEHAAEMLETGELAWIQNRLKDYTYGSGAEINGVTGACLIGSVDHAIEKLYSKGWKAHLYPYTNAALTKATHPAPAKWNDDPERTKEQVVDALKTAAKELRNSADPS